MKVLIADDHDLVRDTLVAYIEASGSISTRTAPDFHAARDLIDTDGPFDVVLLDLDMPGMNGLDGLRKALTLPGAQRVALISGQASRETAQAALDAGAAGFVPKTLPARSLVNAIKFMAMGEQFAPVDFMSGKAEEARHPFAAKLTTREMQVLKGLTAGHSNKEIARDLDLSEPTVKLHVKTLYRKIGVGNRTKAAMVARETGLF